MAGLLSKWIEAGECLADFWGATPRQVLIVIHAYFQRRAWAAWATGMTARGAVENMGDLLPKPPESDEEREARIDRALTKWDMRLDALTDDDPDQQVEPA